MKPEKEFYIGWQDELPAGSRSSVRKFLITVFSLMILIVCLLVISQNPLATSKYEIGNIIEEEGYLYSAPRPTLVQVNENGQRTSILLVSYGKIGADADLENWFGNHIEVGEGSLVRISGTTATYNGETVLELTFKDQSIELLKGERLTERQKSTDGFVSLSGEIVDPKCYFGAMKPGDGKVHRSCAIRCISGGIPPVLACDDGLYYTLQFPDLWPVSDIFSFVGKPVALEGNVDILDGARYLYVSENSLQALLNSIKLDANLAYCKSQASH